MKRIIYCSQATTEIAPDELVSILQVSRRNNERTQLTGMLLYAGQSFLQVLEGDEDALKTTYVRILADDRHTALRLLTDVEVDSPLFPDWTMGFDHLKESELASALPGYTPARRYPLLDPSLITDGAVAQTLLRLYAQNRPARV